MTREDRIAKVKAAQKALPAAMRAAIENEGGVFEELRWEEVEQLGATIHRQCRILAGKKKGG